LRSVRAFELQEPAASAFNDETKPSLLARLDALKAKVVEELKRQGFAEDRIECECYLNMRYVSFLVFRRTEDRA
jgi:5-oxoprolinase (ATP-hydrolysing)